MAGHPVPTRRARMVVSGAYDTHIHIAPDVMKRKIVDVDLAIRFHDVGLAGFVLKSHYVPTAERAAVVRRAVNGVDVLGAITLNGSVGGMNPAAVEIAGREGARIVWMPTVDSRNQRGCGAVDSPGATPPMWSGLQDELRAQGIMPEVVPVVDSRGLLLESVRRVLSIVAKFDMVLATGHLAAEEIMLLVPAAVAEGVRRVVVTHPEFTSQRLPVETQRQLADQGAMLERCFTTPYTGKVSWEQMCRNIRDVGVEHSVLSSDLGQPFNPPVEDGLALMADRLLNEGFSEEETHRMAVVNSRAVAAPPGGYDGDAS